MDMDPHVQNKNSNRITYQKVHVKQRKKSYMNPGCFGNPHLMPAQGAPVALTDFEIAGRAWWWPYLKSDFREPYS